MTNKKICLASDNWSAVHPSVMQALAEANDGFAPSYGSDSWTEQAQQIIQEAFKTKCKVFIVPTGTGANIFGLKLACRSYESVLCTDIAHIQYHECGAAESLIGCKLLAIPHQEGKLTPKSILKKLEWERAFGKHSTSPRILSIA
jgi:threonine aldolase